MPVHQLSQLAGYKQFTHSSNNMWQVGNPTHGKRQKGVNCYTTVEYTTDSVTCYAWYI